MWRPSDADEGGAAGTDPGREGGHAAAVSLLIISQGVQGNEGKGTEGKGIKRREWKRTKINGEKGKWEVKRTKRREQREEKEREKERKGKGRREGTFIVFVVSF